jgi:hypothetical protein
VQTNWGSICLYSEASLSHFVTLLAEEPNLRPLQVGNTHREDVSQCCQVRLA